MIVKLLTEHHLEFLSLNGGCRGSSESTLVKMSNCWKSHAVAHVQISRFINHRIVNIFLSIGLNMVLCALIEIVLLSTYNIYSGSEITKIIFN